MSMPDRGFRTITVNDQVYEQVKQRAKKENKSVATFASEALEIMLFIEDKFSKYAPFLELISLDSNEVVVRDNKKDRIVGVKAKAADNGKVRLYCELDDTDYCPHTAFAAALPQVRNAIRR
jgi:hypothetical protein